MHLLDQLRVRRATGPLTSVPTYASATTGRVCAPEHHTHDEEAGESGRWLMMNWLSSFSRPSFSSLRPKGSTHACTRIQPPLHMTALPIRPFWTNTRQTAGSNILFLGRVSAAAPMGDQAFISPASIGSATGTYVHMSMSVHNNIPGRGSLSPPSLCPMSASLVIWPQILGALFLRP